MGDIEKTTIPDKEFDLDDFFQPLGGFGKFQKVNILHFCLLIMLASITELSYVFTAGEVPHRCLIAECESLVVSKFQPSWLAAAIPLTENARYGSCMRRNRHVFGPPCSNTSFTQELVICDSFVYETEEWTIAREDWGIHCDKDRWMLTLIGSLSNAGVVVGAFFVGSLSDRFGRKTTIISTTISVAFLGTIQSFSANYLMFAILEFLGNVMASGIFTVAFMLALEIVEPSKRVLAGTLVNLGYVSGEIILGMVQWLTLDWRTLLRVVKAPFFMVVVYYWTIPESVRWLMSKGRLEDALRVLKIIASTNGTVITREAENSIRNQVGPQKLGDAKDQSEFIVLLKSKKMRMRFIASLSIWIANIFVFFGMSLNSVNLNENKFLNFMLTVLMDIPANLTVFLLLDRIGRRTTQSGSLFLCAIGCFMFAFVPEDWYKAQLVLFLVGKFGIGVSFIAADVYTTELFPTNVRGTATSTVYMVARVSAILAPQTPLLSDIYKPLPLLLFGTLSTVSGALTLSLPETFNIKLPDTVAEAEALEMNRIK